MKTRKYRAVRADCLNCSSKAKCCPNTDVRTINREKFEIVRDFARRCVNSEFNPTVQRTRKKVESNRPVKALWRRSGNAGYAAIAA